MKELRSEIGEQRFMGASGVDEMSGQSVCYRMFLLFVKYSTRKEYLTIFSLGIRQGVRARDAGEVG